MSAVSMADGPVPVLLEDPPVPESDRAEVEPPIAPGKQLAGRYALENVLAEGGMGVVWLGRHVELDKPVAIKFLRRALCGREAVVARFLNEARAAAALRSTHVVRVMDVGQLDSGRPYLVMEHLQGIDLDALVERDGALPVDQAVDYVLEVCEALSEAHAAGIVHRDIKPENLFLSHVGAAKPIVKVVDFGLAKRLDAAAAKVVTGPLENMGSPCYMSPEQIDNPQELDERTDIWSLGVVLYRLLTGALPFDGDSVTEVCAHVLNATPVPLVALRPDLDVQLDAIVLRCLEKKPGDRYASITELEAALRRYVEAAMSATRPASISQSSLRLLAPPKRTSDRPEPTESALADEPIVDIPGVRKFRVRSLLAATLLGFVVPLAVYGAVAAGERMGLSTRILTDGWLTPAALPAGPDMEPPTAPPPRFEAAFGDGKGPLRVTAERQMRPGSRRVKPEPPRVVIVAHTAKPAAEEVELTPEEIVRRKLAYEEYLQSHGYEPIRDVLQKMRSEGTATETNGARVKAGERRPKVDAPRP